MFLLNLCYVINVLPQSYTETHFPRELAMTNKHMKWFLTSLTFMKMQIKTELNYYSYFLPQDALSAA